MKLQPVTDSDIGFPKIVFTNHFNSLKKNLDSESWTCGHYDYLFKYAALGTTYIFKYLVGLQNYFDVFLLYLG